jgi:hypothetical protein
MTRRERLERKLERRQEWAEKAADRSEALAEASHKMMSVIPMGQPILIGHHSEKRDRNYRNRAWNKMGKSVEQADLAKHHEQKAAGLSDQLDRTIFSDDPDAIENIEARIAENEAKRKHMKTVNALFRKGNAAGLAELGIDLEKLKADLAAKGAYWGSKPFLPYELSNLGQRITSDRKRLEFIKDRQARTAEAAAAPNGVTFKECANGYCAVTFAEKPVRVKAAGFFWCKGYWGGKIEALPQIVKEVIAA